MAEPPLLHCADMSYGATKAVLETHSNVVVTQAHQDDLDGTEVFPGSVSVVAVNFRFNVQLSCHLADFMKSHKSHT